MDNYSYHKSRGRGAYAADERNMFHRGGNLIGEILTEKPAAQILFVGSLNCLRHKPFLGIAEYMREGKVSLLCPTMTDFASGRYLQEIKEAVRELSEEKEAREFVLIYSCQWVILSTDGELLKQELEDELGITLTLWDDSHLVNGDHS